MSDGMTYTLDVERSGDVAVVRVGGRIDSSNAWMFEAGLQGSLKASDQVLIMDCGELRYISSAGLRVSLKLAQHFRPPRRFAMCALSEDIDEIVRISGFDRIIALHVTVEEALADI